MKLFAYLLILGFSLVANAKEYKLDPLHTFVEWHISHFGFSSPSGKWPANGTLEYDPQKPELAKVEAKIMLADINTAIPELDKHLKSKLFFDVTQFPMATFVSNKVELKNKQVAKVFGNLSLHGVTKAVILDVNFNKIGQSPLTDKETVGFNATTTIKRSDFGINTLLPGLGDDVKLDITVEAGAA